MVRYTILLGLFFSALLIADNRPEEDEPRPGPVTFKAEYLHFVDADFDAAGHGGEELGFRQMDLESRLLFPIYQDIYGGLMLGVTGSFYDWDENPHFSEDEFWNFNFGLGAFTKRWECWLWRLFVVASMNIDNGSFGENILYQGILWGRWTWTDEVDLHLGFVTRHGLEDHRYMPLLGIDWETGNWDIAFIVPVKMGVAYWMAPCWKAFIKARFLRDRHRVRSDETTSRAIFEWRAFGAELGVMFQQKPKYEAALFLGHTGKGDFRVHDNEGRALEYFDVKGTWYLGGHGAFNF